MFINLIHICVLKHYLQILTSYGNDAHTGSAAGADRSLTVLDLLGARPVRGCNQGHRLRQMAALLDLCVLTRFQLQLFSHYL